MVSRNGSDQVPHGDFQLRHGDHLTLVSESSEAMREAFDRCRAG
jgi:Trk K+ transport system NAD-binding subunit